MLTAGTRLVGLIGDPVSHSLSPRMQNAAFAALGLDWAYVPLAVEAARLEGAVAGGAAPGALLAGGPAALWGGAGRGGRARAPPARLKTVFPDHDVRAVEGWPPA